MFSVDDLVDQQFIGFMVQSLINNAINQAPQVQNTVVWYRSRPNRTVAFNGDKHSLFIDALAPLVRTFFDSKVCYRYFIHWSRRCLKAQEPNSVPESITFLMAWLGFQALLGIYRPICRNPQKRCLCWSLQSDTCPASISTAPSCCCAWAF